MNRILLGLGLVVLAPNLADAQPAAQIRRDVQNRVVMVADGAGFIVGKSESALYVVTAGHVLKRRDSVPVKFAWDLNHGRECHVTKNLWDRNVPPSDQQSSPEEAPPDLGLVRCDLGKNEHVPRLGPQEVISWTNGLRKGDPVTVIGQADKKFYTPGVWAAIAEDYKVQKSGDIHFITVPSGNLGLSPDGFSGAALLSVNSEVLGIVSFQDASGAFLNVTPWTTVVKALSDCTDCRIQLRRVAPSGLAAPPSQTQLTFGTQTIQIPNFGVASASPWFRVSKAIPGFPYLQAAFEFSSTRHADSLESLQINMPAATAQYQLAHAIPWLRRHAPVAGAYVGGGIGWAIMDDTDRRQGFFEEQKSQTWAGIFETGMNYRLPGRRWGIHGAYREYLVSNPAGVGNVQIQLAHPRFRGFSFGMFYRLN